MMYPSIHVQRMFTSVQDLLHVLVSRGSKHTSVRLAYYFCSIVTFTFELNGFILSIIACTWITDHISVIYTKGHGCSGTVTYCWAPRPQDKDLLRATGLLLVPGTGKSHQNTSAGKFDPERAIWNCWLLALFNDVIVYDVTTHTTTLPAMLSPLSMALNVINLNKFVLKSIVFQVREK